MATPEAHPEAPLETPPRPPRFLFGALAEKGDPRGRPHRRGEWRLAGVPAVQCLMGPTRTIERFLAARRVFSKSTPVTTTFPPVPPSPCFVFAFTLRVAQGNQLGLDLEWPASREPFFF